MKLWRKPFDGDSIPIPRGEIHILQERCKGCAFCVEYCPNDVLSLSSEFNLKGYHPPEVVFAEKCVDCRLCETLCPEFAIYVTLRTGPAIEPAAGPAHGKGATRHAS